MYQVEGEIKMIKSAEINGVRIKKTCTSPEKNRFSVAQTDDSKIGGVATFAFDVYKFDIEQIGRRFNPESFRD